MRIVDVSWSGNPETCYHLLSDWVITNWMRICCRLKCQQNIHTFSSGSYKSRILWITASTRSQKADEISCFVFRNSIGSICLDRLFDYLFEIFTIRISLISLPFITLWIVRYECLGSASRSNTIRIYMFFLTNSDNRDRYIWMFFWMVRRLKIIPRIRTNDRTLRHENYASTSVHHCFKKRLAVELK